MAKTSVTQWDTVAGNNLDINGISLAEMCPTAGINDALRTLMAQFAAFLTAPTFSGPIKRDTQFYLDVQSGNLIINFKANCYLKYDPIADHLVIVINGVAVFSLDGGGNLTLKGSLFQNGAPA